MTIDTSKILGIYQPLCMVELIKSGANIQPISGAYFGVPFMVGEMTGEETRTEGDWAYWGEVYYGEYHNIKKEDGNGNVVEWEDWEGWDGYLSARNLTPYEEFKDSEFEHFKFEQGRIHYYEGRLGAWTRYTYLSIYRKLDSHSDNRSYVYLAKVDGMPYSFGTSGNAQRWIDATMEREAATKPKQGVQRILKIASLTGHLSKVRKSKTKALQRIYLDDALKQMALEMIDAEIDEINIRLRKI